MTTALKIPISDAELWVLAQLDGNYAGTGLAPVRQGTLYDGFLQTFAQDVVPVLEGLVQRRLIAQPLNEKGQKQTHNWHITALGQTAYDQHQTSRPSPAPLRRGRPPKNRDAAAGTAGAAGSDE